MATITNAVTISKQARGTTTRYRFRYTLDNGDVHERNAWVSSTIVEADERTARGTMMLDELAQAEINEVLS